MVEAGSAEEAMAAIQTVPVDILVTDVNLPGASGPILAERTRALHPLARIIFATGDPSAVGTIDNAAVLAKPYGAGRLLELIAMDPRRPGNWKARPDAAGRSVRPAGPVQFRPPPSVR